MKWFIIILLNVTLCQAQFLKPKFDFNVEASNGGPNGFNIENCSCNSFLNKYTLELRDTGFSPINSCCLEDFPEEAKKLYDELLKIVNANKTESSTLKRSGFVLWYDIKDSKNFKARIYKE